MFSRFSVLFIVLTLILSGCSTGNIDTTTNQDNKEAPISESIEVEEVEVENDGVSNTLGNTNGNMLNQGLATQQGNWLFYTTGDKIYKEKKDGTEKEEINTGMNDGNFMYLNVIGEWVYFINDMSTYEYFVNEDDSKLFRIKIDGTGLQQLTKDDVYRPLVKEDIIYLVSITDSFRLYKMETDGSDYKQITNDEAFTFNIIDDWIYYPVSSETGEVSLYRMEFNEMQEEKTRFIFDNVSPSQMILRDDTIYYLSYSDNKFNLYSQVVDSGNKLLLQNDVIDFNIQEDKIYYSKNGEGISSMDLEGENITKLSIDEGVNLSIIDNWIYYNFNGMTIRMKTDGSDRQRLDI